MSLLTEEYNDKILNVLVEVLQGDNPLVQAIGTDVPLDVLIIIAEFAATDPQADAKAEASMKKALKRLGEDDKLAAIKAKKTSKRAWWEFFKSKDFQKDLSDVSNQ